MMIAVRLCLALTALLLITGPGRAEEVLGTWTSDKGGMRVKFEPCGDALCGNIVWLKPGSDSKARLGDRLFYDMRPDAQDSWTGKANYRGSVYLGKMSIEGTSLRTSGCIIGGVFCKSAIWRRAPQAGE
jgi:uncharacterized protein (DUF2147 family)